MAFVDAWTGRTACALQNALRLSNELFAERLGIAPRTVAAWHQKSNLRPNSEMQRRLDNALDRAPESVKERFAQLADAAGAEQEPVTEVQEQDPDAADAERRLLTDLNATLILDWLDQCSGWPPGSSRRKVAGRLARFGWPDLQDRGQRRGRVDQRRIAEALTEYYGDHAGGYGTYCARYGDSSDASTSVLTRADWLDLDCALSRTTISSTW